MKERSFFKALKDKLYGDRGPKIWITSDKRVFECSKDALRHAVKNKIGIITSYQKEL